MNNITLSYEEMLAVAESVGNEAFRFHPNYLHASRARFVIWKKMHMQMMGSRKGSSRDRKNYHTDMIISANKMIGLIDKQLKDK